MTVQPKQISGSTDTAVPGQSKLESVIEAGLNAVAGYMIAIAAQMTILPAYGVDLTIPTHFLLGLWMTAISMIRSFLLRRYFNRTSAQGQSRAASMIEAGTNMLVGYTIAVGSQMAFLIALGLTVSVATNMTIGAWMALVSIARSYLLRRLFNWRLMHRQRV